MSEVQLFARFGERIGTPSSVTEIWALSGSNPYSLLIMLKAPLFGFYSRIEHMARGVPAPILCFL
jgi:hypothetical protein